MGNLVRRIAEQVAARKAAGSPAAAPAAPNAPRSANWLLARHRASQGFGAAPADPAPPAAPATATVPSAPSGGAVLTPDEERRRNAAGLRLP